MLTTAVIRNPVASPGKHYIIMITKILPDRLAIINRSDRVISPGHNQDGNIAR